MNFLGVDIGFYEKSGEVEVGILEWGVRVVFGREILGLLIVVSDLELVWGKI